MEIQTVRLEMIQITDKDWELFASLHLDPTVIGQCFNEPTLQELKESFASRLPLWTKNSKHWLCLTMILKETNEKIGVTGLRLVDGDAEVGYLILPQYHNLGFATESLKALIKWAYEVEGIKSFNAVVTKGNASSEKVLTKTGFSLKEIVPDAYEIEGKLHADCIYSMEI